MSARFPVAKHPTKGGRFYLGGSLGQAEAKGTCGTCSDLNVLVSVVFRLWRLQGERPDLRRALHGLGRRHGVGRRMVSPRRALIAGLAPLMRHVQESLAGDFLTVSAQTLEKAQRSVLLTT